VIVLSAALTLLLAAQLPKGSPREVFPELTPEKAAALIRPAVTCPGMTIEVIRVRQDESRLPSERLAFLRLSTGASAWALFAWPPGDGRAWDAWDGTGNPPGAWLLTSFLNVGAAKLSDRFVLDPAVKQAMADIRTIATAIEGWGVDKNEYPEGSLRDLFSVLVPKYSRRLRLVDPWGSPYLYRVQPGSKQNYFVASPGADRRYQHTEAALTEILNDSQRWIKEHHLQPSLSPDTDLIMFDGGFISFVEPSTSLPISVSGRPELGCPPLYLNVKKP